MFDSLSNAFDQERRYEKDAKCEGERVWAWRGHPLQLGQSENAKGKVQENQKSIVQGTDRWGIRRWP